MTTDLSTTKRIQRPFDYIKSGSAGKCLDTLFELIRTDSVVNDWCQGSPRELLFVKTDLKFRVTRTGRIRIRRFYWSLQRSAQLGKGNFSARTLILEPQRAPQWLDFPDDPQLPAAWDLLSNGYHKQVLHYVPLRRLTLLRQCADENFTVLKLKREGRACDASHRLRQINAYYNTSPNYFSIPIAIDHSQHEAAYRQTFCPGTSLGELFRRSPSSVLIEQLGSSLASFHMLPVTTLPVHKNEDLSVITEKVRQLNALWPAEAVRIQKCLDSLQRYYNPEVEFALCHGDLSLDNVLVDGDRWSFIDLDQAHWGDPVRDIAQILVQLAADSFALNKDLLAIQLAFLSGYQTVRPESISSRALHWHRCRAELDYLYVVFSKDLGNAHSRFASLLRAEHHCCGMV